ncbi:hypothetical protein SCH01S_42_00480 [Sphingomonas changbaiensis NBRC 104936]|uniref:Uncharacterized protein n=1 Tax=Sphingomonas changbaiensis NBRC 104936 TaxID=1219043 RepID=A0A0E9MSA3_9SPHN|nr:hypothetical protein [Sphingomonas changbaiensis]GAO40005.1 hypothetical protein SCH01S_42_00480 [Sphingomonas changbaiensis NBRC 104936]
MKLGPVAFLFAVAAGWAAVRTVMLWPERSAPDRPRQIAWQPALTSVPAPPPAELSPPAMLVLDRQEATAVLAAVVTSSQQPLAAASPARPIQPDVPRQQLAPIYLPQPLPAPKQQHRVSVSAWAILRGTAGPGLASAGQLGGSQTGVRVRYDLGSGLAAAVRVSGPLRSRFGKEAAVALDWRPIRRVPLTFTIERRAGLDRGGRGAFAAGLFGGIDVALPLDARIDGYGQAGLVGLRRRDPYVDGALRVERALLGTGRLRIAAGAGAWGGAQPGAARLDIGPQLVAHVPVGNGGLRVGAEWRARIAGHALPGSGPALSIGADF